MLFARDLPLGVVPIRPYDAEGFEATLSPDVGGAIDWLARLLAPSTYHRHGLADAVCDFVRDVTGSLSHFGELYFEIVESEHDEEQPHELPAVELVPLPPGKIVRIPGHYLQVVPRHAQGEVGKRFVSMPADHVWHLTFPDALGSPRQTRRMLRQLSGVWDLIPNFAMSPQMGSDVPGYDLQALRFAADAEVEHVTRRWGSIPSLQQIQGTTEYYLFARILQFRHAQALIREKLVRDINALLAQLEVEATLGLSGLPSSQTIAELSKALAIGEIDFATAAQDSRVP